MGYELLLDLLFQEENRQWDVQKEKKKLFNAQVTFVVWSHLNLDCKATNISIE